MNKESLEMCFHSLATEARDLCVDKSVPVLDAPPTPLQFIRDWVTPNRPVVIRHAIDHWPALHKWTPDYLRSVLGEKLVTVAVTPDGYADAVTRGRFMLPEERRMRFSDLIDRLSEKRDGGRRTDAVWYAQKQNSCFLDEYSELVCDAASDVPWATQALGFNMIAIHFLATGRGWHQDKEVQDLSSVLAAVGGKSPDAVNFWIGDERAVTSMHKDFYENLYCVVSGHKTFTMLPPSDQPYVPYEKFPSAVYRENSTGEFDVIDQEMEVPWIPIDPLAPDLDLYPAYAHARPVRVRVCAGDVLYLPSLWYHHVQQSHACIAINFWYDMEYDVKYNYFKFVEKLKLAAAGSDIGGSDIGGSDIGGSDIDGSESSQE